MPNPSNGKFNVEVNNGSINTIEVFNLVGAKIYSKNIKQQNSSLNGRGEFSEIDLSSSPKGIYFVKIYNGEKICSKKIIIE